MTPDWPKFLRLAFRNDSFRRANSAFLLSRSKEQTGSLHSDDQRSTWLTPRLFLQQLGMRRLRIGIEE